MTDEPKPSARAIAAGKAISDRLLEVTYLGDRDAAGIIDQHFRAHDELLAACKIANAESMWLADDRALKAIRAAVALAEPE